MSYLLTREVAKRATDMIWPAIMELVADRTFKRGDLHIVVAIRVMPFVGEELQPIGFDDSILYEYSHTDPGTWEFPFDEYARSKCLLSWRHGLSTQEIQTRMPHLLEGDSTVYYGSAVRDGIVVACSGVQPYFDQMISEWVLEACRALCIQQRETLEKTHKNGFIR